MIWSGFACSMFLFARALDSNSEVVSKNVVYGGEKKFDAQTSR